MRINYNSNILNIISRKFSSDPLHIGKIKYCLHKRLYISTHFITFGKYFIFWKQIAFIFGI